MQNESDGKRLKTSGKSKENSDAKAEGEPCSGKPAEQSNQPPPEPPKQDYIHVRARRGQATDSHSLAERVNHSYSFSFILCYSYLRYLIVGHISSFREKKEEIYI